MGQSEGKELTWVAPDVAAGAQGKGQCLRAYEEPLPLSLCDPLASAGEGEQTGRPGRNRKGTREWTFSTVNRGELLTFSV